VVIFWNFIHPTSPNLHHKHKNWLRIIFQEHWQNPTKQTLKLKSVPLSVVTKTQPEVEGIDDAPVKIRHLSIGITAMIAIKLIITNSLNSVHTKK
jgi:hypothetical protein